MGFGRNPLINGLIQHTFKLNFIIVKKITVIPFDKQKLFVLITNHHDVIDKKKLLKTKKSDLDFQLATPPPSLPSKKKKKTLEKSLSLHICGGLSTATEAV